jgi:sensor histidine kinase YesM
MGNTWYSKKWVVVLLHTAAWVLLFSIPFLLRPSIGHDRPNQRETESAVSILRYILNSLTYIGVFYLNAEWLMPRFIHQRKYRQFAAAVSGLFAFLLLFTWLLHFRLLHQPGFNIKGHILFNFFFFLFFLAGSTAYAMIKDRARTDRTAREKETENLKTELSLLRSQVSPHFMFNVLNNMVALARKKSDLLEPSLIKLSSLMRYMIYETDEEKVPLEKEIEYLQSYIDLQKQRFGQNVAFNVSLKDVDSRYEIEPMLLIPFVENAIKHGTGFIENAQIDIELTAKNNMLHFMVRNKYNSIPLEITERPSGIVTVEIKDKSSGIGLANVKRRLNLLYSNNHSLLINKDGNWFTVSLQLNLH